MKQFPISRLLHCRTSKLLKHLHAIKTAVTTTSGVTYVTYRHTTKVTIVSTDRCVVEHDVVTAHVALKHMLLQVFQQSSLSIAGIVVKGLT